MTTSPTKWWVDGLTEECVRFQLDLSCLIDGEIEESAGARAIAHLEGCAPCREFFEDAREQVRAHRDMANPDGLVQRYATLLGVDVADEVESIELVCKLAQVFYQLGKAYVLTAIDPNYRTQVFEDAVPLESTRTKARGFVDGVLQSGRGQSVGVDWRHARHMFNGRLSEIDGPLDKGKRLLREAVAADPNHEEARIYLAYVDIHEGRFVRAATEFRRVFNAAIDPSNRGHAAVQLATLYSREGEYRRAIACCRWVTASGLADTEERFFVVRYNLGTYYARLRDSRRSIAAFRELLDRHPGRTAEVAGFFAVNPELQAVIDSQPGFTQELFEACPELFVTQDPSLEQGDGAAEGNES